MRVVLYSNKAENNRVVKTSNKHNTLIADVTAVVKEPCDILSPIITLGLVKKSHLVNYVYIPHWGRYYYVTALRHMPSKRMELSLTVDVLGSWSSQIKAMQCLVSRQENLSSGLMDDLIPVEQKKDVTIIKPTTPSPFTRSLGADAYSVVITTTGSPTVTPTDT